MPIFLILILGLLIGTWFFFSFGTFIVILLIFVSSYVLWRNLKGFPHRRLILVACSAAILIRLALAFFNYYFSYSNHLGSDMIGDARAYSGSGQYIAEVVTKRAVPDVDGNELGWANTLRATYKGQVPSDGYRVDFFAKYVGWFYSIFGYDPVALKFLNCFFSVATAVLLFYFLKDMVSSETAIIAFLMTIFWPSLLIWSVTGTKDSITVFSIMFSIFIFHKLSNSLNPFELFLVSLFLFFGKFSIDVSLLAAMVFSYYMRSEDVKNIRFAIISVVSLIILLKSSIGILGLLRLHIAIPLLVSFILSALFYFIKKSKAASFTVLLVSILFACFHFNSIKSTVRVKFNDFVRKAIIVQTGQLAEASSGYKVYPDRFYESEEQRYSSGITLSEVAGSYAKGVVCSLLVPFPWDISLRSGLHVYCLMFVYYALLLFVPLGVILCLRYLSLNLLPVFIFTFIVLSMYGLFEGNAGTVFRHRDIITIFIIVFGSIGLSKIFRVLALNNPS